MPSYKSKFISLPDDADFMNPASEGPLTADPAHVATLLRARGVRIGETSTISSVPRICYTSVRDAVGYPPYKDLTEEEAEQFHGAITIGENCHLDSDSVRPPFHSACIKLTSVQANDHPPGKITIGNGVTMYGTAIVSYSHVDIGDNVGIATQVTIMDCDGHTLEGRGTETEIANLKAEPVIIGEGSWIGTGALIMKGVKIGKNCVVGANSVVIRSVPDGAVVMGNPARIVRQS